MSSIGSEDYKGETSVVLQNDVLQIILLPCWGAKIASIFYKPRGVELLWQNPGTQYKKTVYADPYDAGEASGFDEMFPTISRCFYETEPWAGTEMPDHGEVWSIPWDYKTTESEVKLSVKGVRFPYTLQKTVSIDGARFLQRYSVSNHSEAAFDYIWAAHPLFNTTREMKLIVPHGMNRIVNAVPSKRLGPYGRMLSFPRAETAGGHVFDLSSVPEKNSGDYQKYWFSGKVRQGWCSLHNPVTKINIDMSWPAKEIPYLGVWVNEGGWAGQYNIAPEPASAAMDRVDFSRMWGVGSRLKGGETKQWELAIAVSEGHESAPPKGS